MRNRVAIAVTPLVLLGLAMVIDFVLVWRLFYFSMLMIAVLLVWALVARRGVRGEASKVSAQCKVGERLEQDISVTNTSRLPKLAIEVRDNSELPGQSNMVAFNMPGRSSRAWRSQELCRKRGRYKAGSHAISLADPLGFFPFRKTFGESRDVLVYPATFPLPYFSPLARDDLAMSSNRWLGSGVSPDASRVREYANGDSYNRIHWPSTAHAQQLMVKVFDPHHSRKVAKTLWVALDMEQAAQAGHGLDSTEERGVTIAASIVEKYATGGLPVGLLVNGGTPIVFPPETGERHMWRVMEALAVVNAAGGVPVEQLISAEHKRFTPDAILIVITPSANTGIDLIFRRLANHGTATAAILLDTASFGGSASPSHVAWRLRANGTQVYIVKRGDTLASALDSRNAVMN